MKSVKYLLFFVLSAIAFMSCDHNYPLPPFVEPQFTLAEGEELITIEQLKSFHTLGSTPFAIDKDYVVTGVVVGDDESGNIYKSLYVQDETGGINFAIDHVNMYNIMPVGQKVYVRLKGLFVGDYNNGYQVGDTVTDPRYGLEMARYNWTNELVDSTRHFFLHGLPSNDNLPQPRIINSANEVTTDMYCTLVTLNGVRFPESVEGLTWAEKEQTVNRSAKFADGSIIVVRTSGYCNFYADPIPSGVGSVTGILAIFGSTKQLYIRSREDIKIREE